MNERLTNEVSMFEVVLRSSGKAVAAFVSMDEALDFIHKTREPDAFYIEY